MNFISELNKRILILDGSMGALLQNRGLPAGMAPDVWMLDHPDIILGAHQEYVNAGADILLTNTFGASKWRLDEYDAYSKIHLINAKAVELARRAAGDRVFVAGDIGPSGETIFPTGHRPFEEAAQIFYEQAKILIELGVDLLVIETMFDSLELRAALSGARAASLQIPIIAHATFNVDAITDTGATPENICAIAEGFHATAVGVNCSTGPEPMVQVVERMARTTNLHISVQPNAGLPRIEHGRTVFPMKETDLKPYIRKFATAGAGIIGGCCGTTPAYIKLVKEFTSDFTSPRKSPGEPRVLISSLSQAVSLGGASPFVAIGERMNPSGRKKLSESLRKNDLSVLLEDAELQMLHKARVLDLNVGVPLADEPELMKQAVVAVQNRCSTPLMIDSADSFALDKGASVYYGRPLLNSLNAEEEKLHEAIPIMRKHGAAVVCMLTGTMVPVEAEERIKNGQKIADILFGQHGFKEEDIVFDCLGLVVSAMQDGSRETLRTIAMIKQCFPRAATTLGLSNVSFGLPNRSFVHNAFLATAVQHGLDTAIMSVTDPMGPLIAAAAQMWGPKPKTIDHFINHFSEKLEMGSKASLPGGVKLGAKQSPVIEEPEFLRALPALDQQIFRNVVDGQKDEVIRLVSQFLEERSSQSMDLFLSVMTPAIRHLGDLFGARVKFIPHLIAAADAMKEGVRLLEPHLIAARAASGQERGTIIFATVKGDIHDIGKNICILMLRNFGFRVIDLGRNVDPELIIETGIKEKAQVLALSALMTTTMMQMKVVVDAVRERHLPFKVVIGGAVVTPDFAREIKADGFSTDVGTVVSELERVLSVLKAADVFQ